MATLAQTGIPGISNGILHPRPKNKFRVIFIGLGGALGAQANIPNDMSQQVVTFTRPSVSFEEIQLDRYNSRVYVMGKQTFEPCTLTFEDDITGRAVNALDTQLETQQRLIGVTGPWLNTEATAATYKFGMLLEGLDGNEVVTEQWKYEGCMIQAADYDQHDYATGERMIITTTIRFDHVRHIIGNLVTGSAIGGLVQ